MFNPPDPRFRVLLRRISSKCPFARHGPSAANRDGAPPGWCCWRRFGVGNYKEHAGRAPMEDERDWLHAPQGFTDLGGCPFHLDGSWGGTVNVLIDH